MIRLDRSFFLTGGLKKSLLIQPLKQLGNRLTLNGGGPLGIQSVREIVLAVENLKAKREAWGRLLGKPFSGDLWHVGTGPSIHLIEGKGPDRIHSVILEAQSLGKAKQYLKTQKLLAPDGLSLNLSKVQQLRISLVESTHTRTNR